MIPIRAVPYLAAAIALAASHLGAYRHGISIERAEWQAKADKAQADAMQQVAEAQEKARHAEQASAIAMANIDAAYLKGRTDAQAESDRTIADLRAGSVSLRQRFTCPPAAPAGGMPKATTGTGQRDAASEGGLRSADAEFLVQLADRADQVTRQLEACQAVIRQDRGQ